MSSDNSFCTGTHPIAVAIAKKLGIATEQCVGFSLHVYAGEIIKVVHEFHPTQSQLEAIATDLEALASNEIVVGKTTHSFRTKD